MATWKIYQGNTSPRNDWTLPPAPTWRDFKDDDAGAVAREDRKGENFEPPDVAIKMVNAAICLRRPLLITGDPGTGKSTLAYSVARELELGKVLKWSITTRTLLKDGLYSYDAIARVQDAQTEEKDNRKQVGDYITLGALGTAFLPTDKPRVLLIDEIDKSDIDLPNDLLNLFEEGEFAIPELQRLSSSLHYVNSYDREITGDNKGKPKKAGIFNGFVRCRAFPLVIMTSNGERDFPPPFLRRCLRLKMPSPDLLKLGKIVTKHFNAETSDKAEKLIESFFDSRASGTLATDQLLNAIHMRLQENFSDDSELDDVLKRLLQSLSSAEDE
ncbi:AAA family ATPase [Tumidithrix helvetica PCC 7403]|uniref:AAA family ATPase n=1 Tax=Tumidithrix helvetica TaxID=3457545 RepID=UPI003C873452